MEDQEETLDLTLEPNLGKENISASPTKPGKDTLTGEGQEESDGLRALSESRDSATSALSKETNRTTESSNDGEGSKKDQEESEENGDDEIITLEDENEEEDEESEEGKTPRTPRTPRMKGRRPGSRGDTAEKITPGRTPKMSKEEREAEREKKRIEREHTAEAKRLEKEKKEKEKEEKRKLEEERREQKKKEEDEKKEKKRKEEEERREKKRKEEEEKAEEKRKREDERRKKEEERLKKEQEKEDRKEAKRKEEEEKKEAKRLEEEALEEKKRRASNRFIGFFKKVEKKDENETEEKSSESTPLTWYLPFQIKEGMRKAPIHWREPLDHAVDVLAQDTSADYLTSIKGCPLQNATRVHNRSKLFQFHCNYRPPYYGTWNKRSAAIRGRRPFAQCNNLDYEVDSDEEWEDEPSDAEECKSDEEDVGDEEMSEDENNGFMVEHAYLSEGEGESNDEDDEEMEDEQREEKMEEDGEESGDSGPRPPKKRCNKRRLSSPTGRVRDEAEQDAADTDAEARRVRLASRAREYTASVQRKKQKLVPFVWFQSLIPEPIDTVTSSELKESSSRDRPSYKLLPLPEALTGCTVVSVAAEEEDEGGEESGGEE